jgi:hypothetical protein
MNPGTEATTKVVAGLGSGQVDLELHQAQSLVEAISAAIRGEHGHGVKLVALVRGILEIDATKEGSFGAPKRGADPAILRAAF